MGNNSYGQLGDGTLNNTNKPEQITNGEAAIAGGYHSLFIKTNGSLLFSNCPGSSLPSGTVGKQLLVKVR
jgi:hypothetical protein